MFRHHQENWHASRFSLVYSYFSTLHTIFSLEVSGDFSQVKFISPVREFWEKANSFVVTPSKMAKSWYFFHFHLFTFHSLVWLLFSTVKLNGASQQILKEYKMVHASSQAVFRT